MIVSANAHEAHGAPLAQPFHDAFLIKPIDMQRLLETDPASARSSTGSYEAEQAAPAALAAGAPARGRRCAHVDELIDSA